ncbi:MAG: sel1 repeat family protein [Bacteroidales bacterium]|nr:sel1 repeat family protein [Bacteroidales bacterium]
MLLFTLPIAIVVGIIISRYYTPQTRAQKIWASILIPFVGGFVIHLIVAGCINSKYGFGFDLGSTLVLMLILEIALLVTLLIALKVGDTALDGSTLVKLHTGSGDNRVEFEVYLTQEQLLQMAKTRQQNPEKWKDNEYELVKTIRPDFWLDSLENQKDGKNDSEQETQIVSLQQDGITVTMSLSSEIINQIDVIRRQNPNKWDDNEVELVKEAKGILKNAEIKKQEETSAEPQIVDKQIIVKDLVPDNLSSNSTSNTTNDDEELRPKEILPTSNDQKINGKTNLNKCLKVLIIITLSLGTLFGLGMFGSWIFTHYIYPSQAKSEDELLMQQAKMNPSKGYEIAQILCERCHNNHKSEFENPITHKHGSCNFDHEKAGKEAAALYCEYKIDIARTHVTISENIALNLFDLKDDCFDDVYIAAGKQVADIYCEYCIRVAMAHIDTAYSIAKYLFLKKDGFCEDKYIQTGIKIIKHAAEKGNVDAQYMLGCYYCGREYNKTDGRYNSSYTLDNKNIDYDKAAYWWLQAANQGHTDAMGNLGTCYMEGFGVPKNEKKGVELIQQAANMGNEFFRRLLGDYYRDGVKMVVGSHKETRKTTDYVSDSERVRSYWDSAKGATIYVYLENVIDYKTILHKDIKKAQYWWKKAAEGEDEIAKERLQQIFE